MWRVSAGALAAAVVVAMPLANAQPSRLAPASPVYTRVQTQFLVRCGGCHGLGGRSVPRVVPTLKDQVGFFMATSAGRAYVVQLPNVAHAPLDDAALADLLNFVVFDLGGRSTPMRTPPFTAEEVAGLRRAGAIDGALRARRDAVVRELVQGDRRARVLQDYRPERERGR